MSVRIADLLGDAQAAGVGRADAQRLAAHQLGRSREWVIAHDDQLLPDARDVDALRKLLQRRAAGEPLAYLVGRREFHGLTLLVDRDVLVPRPETELLVEWALELLEEGRRAQPTASPDVVDLGTGSGAIALAVKHAAPWARLSASDASAAALEVARRNAAHLGLAVDFVAGDWWQPLAGRRFALALANPPYIASGDPHLAALAHEPQRALLAHGDGLDALRRIVAGAPQHLRAGAWLLLEHGHDQADAVQAMLTAAGLSEARTRADLAGLPRCTGARWSG